MAPNSVTLSDLKQHNGNYFASFLRFPQILTLTMTNRLKTATYRVRHNVAQSLFWHYVIYGGILRDY